MDSKANMSGIRYMYPLLPSQRCGTTSAEANTIPIIGPHYPIQQPSKTPISELMELSVRMGIEAKFDITGPTPCADGGKEFYVICTFDSINGQGREQSKKRAKQSAAADTLKKLKNSDLYKNHLFNRSSKAALSSHSNTVGRLQEATAKKGLQTPEYQFEDPVGPPHQREFKTKVHVGNLTANGTGRSKKEAKRSAAAAMLDNMNCSNLSLHVPAKKIAFNPASSPIDPRPVRFCRGGILGKPEDTQPVALASTAEGTPTTSIVTPAEGTTTSIVTPTTYVGETTQVSAVSSVGAPTPSEWGSTLSIGPTIPLIGPCNP